MADRSVTVRLSASVSDYMAKMTAAGRATEDLARKVEVAKGRAAAGYRAIGLAGVAAGGLVVAGFAAAAKAAADFDARMALVRTLAKASPADMARLRSAALTVGQAYGYSADQVADAQAELVKAGISVNDILGGALVGSLTLASAGQTDVAQATEIAAAAMTQFRLSGKDIPHLADLLAAGADKALGSVGDLGYGLSQVGTTAHQFGISVDETVGTLSALAEAGQIGEKGGTELNQMLLKLAAPGKQAAAVMKTVGINAYDAQGNFVGLADFAGQLHDKLGPLTQATRTQYETQIFGSRAIKAANVLYQEGAAGIEEWTQKVNTAGFAELQASGKLDSLTGDWQKFHAALTNALIGTGEEAQGPLRRIVQDATTMVDAWNKLPGPVKDATEALVLAGGAITLAGGAALIAIPKVAELNLALEEMGFSAITARGALATIGKVGLVAGVVYGVGEAVNALDNAVKPAAPDVDRLAGSLQALGQGGDVGGELLKTFGANLANFSVQIDELVNNKGLKNPTSFANKVSPANLVGDLFHAVHLPTGWDQTFSNKEKFQQAEENVGGLDQALSRLAQTSGGLKIAKSAWSQLSAEYVASGGDVKNLAGLFPEFADTIQQQATASGDASAATGNLNSQLKSLAGHTRDANKAAKAYNDTLHAAADPLFAMNQALQDLHAKQKAASDAVAKYGADSKQARQANVDLASSLLDVQANATTLAGAVKSGAVSIDNAKAMLHAFIKEGGLTKSQAHDILGIFDHLIGKSKDLNRQRPQITVTANTSQADAAVGQLVSTLRTATAHGWDFVTHLFSGGSKPPGRASGGGAPEGFFTVGEQGPELAYKSGDQVQIFSNSQSKRMIPGFATGTGGAGNVERRLHAIVSDRGASPADVRRAVLALRALSDQWDATLRHIGNAQQLRQMKTAVGHAQSPSERAQAERQLAQFRRQRDQDAATRRIQAAQDIATNRQTWLFEHMSVTEQIAYLDKAMSKEKRFSDQWLQDAEQRRSLRQQETGSLKANRQQWAFENMTAQQQIAYLDKKIAKEKKYSDQWLADMEQRKSLTESLASSSSTGSTAAPVTFPDPVLSHPDIAGARYNMGGPVLGAGSGTSDSIAARLSDGEYVEPTNVAARYRPELDAMRTGRYVPAQRGGGQLVVNVTVNGVVSSDVNSLGRQLVPVIHRELVKQAATRGPLGL
jgi:TP901 family phage tail tape measure protein